MIDVQLLTQAVLPITLALMMLTLGLALTLNDFRRIFNEPKAVLLGVTLQLVLLPAIAWGLIALTGLFIPLSLVVVIGLIILAACPGGATSNVISHLSGGDGALSISMTAVAWSRIDGCTATYNKNYLSTVTSGDHSQ
jgi:bile acid:Na+ symporter, BASS family